MAHDRTVTVIFEGRGSDGTWFKYTQQVDASGGGDNPRFFVEGFQKGLAVASGRIEAAVVVNYGQPS